LHVWRPTLSTTSPFLFLTTHGTPFKLTALADHAKRTVHAYTGKYWHPHMIRSVWATEWILSGGDFITAATMLGDTVQTIIRHYAHLLEEHAVDRAFQWVQDIVAPEATL
jgi:site-specific recombinase XerD